MRELPRCIEPGRRAAKSCAVVRSARARPSKSVRSRLAEMPSALAAPALPIEAADAAHDRIHDDERFLAMTEFPFDGRRMIMGAFEPMLRLGKV